MENVRIRLLTLLLFGFIISYGVHAEDDQPPISGYGPFHPDFIVVPLEQTFKLHSNKGAKHVIFLDFDGHTNIEGKYKKWVYLPMNFEGSEDSFSDEEKTRIQLIWKVVAEDYLPFEIDVTTEQPLLEDLRKTGDGDEKWGVRVVISQYDDDNGMHWALNNSFTSAVDQELYVHQEDGDKNHPISIGDAVSHEVGHTLRLSHDGQRRPYIDYYPGYDTKKGEWSTIMGWTRWSWSQWSKGEYRKSNNKEDDLAIIASDKNGFGYRKDDHGSSRETASKIEVKHAELESVVTGIIERNTDVDYFSFNLKESSKVVLRISPDSFAPNLYIKASLFDASGRAMKVKVTKARVVTFHRTLKAGNYYLAVEGSGSVKGSPQTLDGFSDYGSLGFYDISASHMPKKKRKKK